MRLEESACRPLAHPKRHVGRASGVKFRLTGFCPEGEGNGFPLDREQ